MSKSTSTPRRVYVISDLHLGGAAPPAGAPGRGFRMCTRGDALAAFITALARRAPSPQAAERTELVINGDFVDFLAEADAQQAFAPFTADPAAAEGKLLAIVRREAAVFQALRALLWRGHELTVLLGNHDIELSLPEVRERLLALLTEPGALEEALGAGAAPPPPGPPPGRLRFLLDGEAYIVGDALIEHGNRYDGFNIVDHDALRQLRSLQSRRQRLPRAEFPPPPGSRLVVDIMNPIKAQYPFVDLLKPETGAVVPLLLALEPGLRRHLSAILDLGSQALEHQPQGARPVFRGEISARGRGDDEAALRRVLGDVMGPAQAAAFLGELDDGDEPLPLAAPVFRGDIAARAAPAAGLLDRALGVARLLFASRAGEVERRLPPLLRALRALRQDRSFDRGVERPGYLDAARELADGGGFRYVVFGHTHLAKDLPLAGDGSDGRRYLNSGTWADLLRLPQELFVPDEAQALAFLRGYISALTGAAPGGAALIGCEPTYVRLALGADGRVTEARLCDLDLAAAQRGAIEV